MPAGAVIAAAGLTAAGVFGGAKVASNASNRATQSQERTNASALEYERQRQTERRTRYDAAYKDYRTQYDNWLRQYFGQESPTAPSATGVRAAIDSKHGAEGGTLGSMMATPGPAVPPPTAAMPPPQVPGTTQAPGAAVVPGMQRQAGTLADLGGFANPEDFKRYGLRRQNAAV